LLGERPIAGSDGIAPHPSRAHILMSELTSQTLVLVPVPTFVHDSLTRRRANRASTYRREFTLRENGYKRYVVQTDPMHADAPIEHVDEQALLAIEAFISTSRQELEGIAGTTAGR
jgi:hypothetical protein